LLAGDFDGLMRVATQDDETIVAAWQHEFNLSTRTNITNENEAKEREISITNSKLAIARASRFLWCVNGRPCCVANVEGDSSFGSRISGVYTPLELRGRGYASNLVAFASQHMLNEKKGPCCLNTDLSNPTSNSIYQRIGYRPICDEAAYFYE
jgi:predicted GNAT family acetyltransferase